MKKLRKNSGFTLVECIVAMAVLAVMTLALFMILSVTARQRMQNTQLERDVDNQVEQVVQGNGKVTDFDGDDGSIVFQTSVQTGNEDVFVISGGKKVYYEDADSDLQIGAFTFDAKDISTVTTSEEDIPKVTTSEDKKQPEPGYDITESRKVYGASDLEKDVHGHKITISNNKYEYHSAADPDENGYYAVTWQIKLKAKTITTYKDIQSVKIALPETVKVTKYWSGDSSTYVHLLGSNTLRIEPGQQDSDIYVYVTFNVSEGEFGSYEGNPDEYIVAHFDSQYPEMESR